MAYGREDTSTILLVNIDKQPREVIGMLLKGLTFGDLLCNDRLGPSVNPTYNGFEWLLITKTIVVPFPFNLGLEPVINQEATKPCGLRFGLGMLSCGLDSVYGCSGCDNMLIEVITGQTDRISPLLKASNSTRVQSFRCDYIAPS